MKKLFAMLICAVLALLLAACGGSVDTAKSEELKAQYDYYESSN